MASKISIIWKFGKFFAKGPFLTTACNSKKLAILASPNFQNLPKTCQNLLSTNTAYLAKFRIVTPSDFIQSPCSSSSSREPTASPRSLCSKRWRRKDSRLSRCTPEVGSPSGPTIVPWESRGGLWLVIYLSIRQEQLQTAPMAHPHGARGACRQPYHPCCQSHQLSSIPPSSTQARASLAWGSLGWSGHVWASPG